MSTTSGGVRHSNWFMLWREYQKAGCIETIRSPLSASLRGRIMRSLRHKYSSRSLRWLLSPKYLWQRPLRNTEQQEMTVFLRIDFSDLYYVHSFKLVTQYTKWFLSLIVVSRYSQNSGNPFSRTPPRQSNKYRSQLRWWHLFFFAGNLRNGSSRLRNHWTCSLYETVVCSVYKWLALSE